MNPQNSDSLIAPPKCRAGRFRTPGSLALTAGLTVVLFSCPPVFEAGRIAQAAEVRGELIGGPARPATTNSLAASASSPVTPVSIVTPKGTVAQAGFDKLAAFKFTATDEMILGMGDPLTTSQDIAAQIPSSVKAFNQKEVAITGFMLPVRVSNGKVTEFLLLKNQSMCCYGTTPALNEYVSVRMGGKGAEPIMDQLVTVSGTLHVGETRENHFLTGIYRLDGEKVQLQAAP